jgi:hypothetical protein
MTLASMRPSRVSRPRDSRHHSRAAHPGWLRCSSLKYAHSRVGIYSASSTMQVVDRLIKANKTFDLRYIPGAGHTNGGPYGGE